MKPFCPKQPSCHLTGYILYNGYCTNLWSRGKSIVDVMSWVKPLWEEVSVLTVITWSAHEQVMTREKELPFWQGEFTAHERHRSPFVSRALGVWLDC